MPSTETPRYTLCILHAAVLTTWGLKFGEKVLNMLYCYESVSMFWIVPEQRERVKVQWNNLYFLLFGSREMQVIPLFRHNSKVPYSDFSGNIVLDFPVDFKTNWKFGNFRPQWILCLAWSERVRSEHAFAWWRHFTSKTRMLLVASIVKLIFPIVSLFLREKANLNKKAFWQSILVLVVK